MNIEFETINGQLCQMVEPTPLTLEATFPCVVRWIQEDDSLMGTWIARCIKKNPLRKNSICAYEAGRNGFCSCITDIEKLEVIGYPVVDGSAEWALYQMMQGNKVTNIAWIEDYTYNTKYAHIVDGMIVHDKRSNGIPISIARWIELVKHCAIKSTGWQIYTEPQPTKEPIVDCNNCKYVCKKSNIDYCYMYKTEPTYKVGDWVRTEDGDGEFMSYAKGHVYDNSVFFSVDYVTYDAFIRLTTGKCEVYPVSSLIKLSPSEVVVDFGSGVKGRVCMPDGEWGFAVLDSHNDWIAQIDPDALDATTRELVKGLLKAQDGKK